ncbi:MAG: hypothetical protein CUN56_13305 [Phototrophicales bacterium]|nr:MAG: hypothetical protein CUN56_13305 [Phototrophicales bacterium]RMG73112.1 MAG: DsbA family protein [Chloroflexota bacterium]
MENENQEVARLSKDVINTMIVGVVFMIAGILVGLVIAGNQGVSATQVRTIVQEEVSRAVAGELETVVNTLTEQIANVSIASAGDGSFDAEVLQGLIDTALTDSMERRDREQNYKMDDDPYLGPEDAPVVVVEFSDFLCGFCGRHFQQTLTPLLENYDGYIRYVYRDFPGVGGQNAVQSALAAECADDQGKFWEYHNLLFNNQDQIGVDLTELRTLLIDFAEELQLDVDEFTTCYDSNQYVTEILLDRSDGESVGMRGTPGFLINGRFLSGAQPYEAFAALIDDELAKRGIVLDEES